MVADLLQIGKENAISTSELCCRMGFDTSRELRLAVARERKAGAVILSSCSGGYYLPRNKEEVEEFIRAQDKKARSIMCALQSARAYIRTLEGQLSIDDFEGGNIYGC